MEQIQTLPPITTITPLPETSKPIEQGSLINQIQPTVSVESATFTADPTKSAAENEATKVAFDKSVEDAKITALNDTKINPFKAEELKAPEGIVFDEGISKSFVDIVNKFAISREAAAALTELQVNAVKSMEEKSNSAYEAMQTQWRTETEKDTEIGGKNLPVTLTTISKIMDRYGTPELRGVLDLTGAGNNPHVIKFFHNIAKDFAEGKMIPVVTPVTSTQTIAQKLYPNQN